MATSISGGNQPQLEPIATAIVPIEKAHIGKYAGGRRSRWERLTRTLLVTTASGQAVEGNQVSRWGHPDNKPYLPPPFIDFPASMTLEQIDQFLREQRLEILNRKLMMGEYEMGDPDIRPPSPLPIYDKDGNRTNRRDIRIKTAMTQEQQRLIEHMVGTVPNFTPPAEFKPQKRIRRILIPNEEFPDYNFMGLIIGPRGCNHKRLEAESGAQISIRGRGTQKEGKRCDHQTDEEAAMPQHVHIAADSDEKLERAVQLIEPLLDPSHPIHEEYKKKGLEQLALVNGTGNFLAKSESKCTVCGMTGHFGFECPETRFETYDRADVRCLLCGDRGHVTSDCKIAKDSKITPQQLAAMEKDMNMGKTHEEIAAAFATFKDNQEEYQNMMSELGLATSESYDAIGVDGAPPPPPPNASEAARWMSQPGNNRSRNGLGFVGEDNKDFQLARDGSYRCADYGLSNGSAHSSAGMHGANSSNDWYAAHMATATGGGLNYPAATAGANWQAGMPTETIPGAPAVDMSVYGAHGILPNDVAVNPLVNMFGLNATATPNWNDQAAQTVLNMMNMFQQQLAAEIQQQQVPSSDMREQAAVVQPSAPPFQPSVQPPSKKAGTDGVVEPPPMPPPGPLPMPSD